MKKMFGKRGIAVMAMFAASALSLTACSGGGSSTTDSPSNGASQSADKPAEGGKIKVGVSMPTKTSERWIADGKAVKEGLEKAGYEVDLQFANDDIPTQSQQVDQMITNGANALVIAAIDGTALGSQLDSAAQRNIPVLSYDRLIRDNGNVNFYVSFDNFKVGQAQGIALLHGLGLVDKDGNKVADAPKGPFNIELFAGSPDDNNAGFFFNGAMDVLKPYLDDGTLVVPSGQKDFKTVAILRWQQDVAQKRMEDLITANYDGGTGKLDGVLSPYDGLSRGIITALQGAGYPKTRAEGLPVVTGQDAEIGSVKLINDGVQDSTIFKNTNTLAVKAVEVVKDLVEGKEPEANNTKDYNNGVKVIPSYLLDVVTVYKDDIKKELIDSGYWTEEQVQAGNAG